MARLCGTRVSRSFRVVGLSLESLPAVFVTLFHLLQLGFISRMQFSWIFLGLFTFFYNFQFFFQFHLIFLRIFDFFLMMDNSYLSIFVKHPKISTHFIEYSRNNGFISIAVTVFLNALGPSPPMDPISSISTVLHSKSHWHWIIECRRQQK